MLAQCFISKDIYYTRHTRGGETCYLRASPTSLHSDVDLINRGVMNPPPKKKNLSYCEYVSMTV